ncbi:putative superfamily III holin-X [Frondihabitans sp. PhB188]|uniref:phage holin family protein n=1 Tax=Frondihabitans sp. PhB188 TaxID=2485200 RepID=UPI000FBC0CC4|nr:phage holin family protein [Frondihabitans sp. PhB188]ROQ39979.1 putative superfamily III holin-X [Frondihabitans sp. PhB188]
MGLFDVFDTKPEAGERKSLGSMLASLPDLISRLIRGEIALARAELIAKLKVAGRGIGLLVGAAVFGFILLEVLIAAAILGTATVFPAWLAALLVAAALLVITAALAFVGYRSLKRGVPPVPTETIKNVRSDVHALKGDAAKESAAKSSAAEGDAR